MPAFAKALFLLFFLHFSTVWSGEWCAKTGSHSKTPYAVTKYHLKTLKTRGIKSGSYSLLSIDDKYNHLLVGARNNVFLVDLDNIDNYVTWNVTKPSSHITCDKNKDILCNNFIKIMLPFEDRIFLCWTGKQGTDGCAWRNRTNLSDVPGKEYQGNIFLSAVGPDGNDTAVITEHGTLFTGTLNPFRQKSLIYSKSFKQPRLTEVYTSLMDQSSFFDDVNFVKSFDIGHYVYFFFRERSLECASCGKLKISRVARICKGDLGGADGLRNVFVTFQKAKLSCTDGKDYPVNFNEIQDVWWDNRTSQFYAIFTSHPNAPPSSAICIYSLSSINQVFDESSFKSFPNNEEHWTRIENKHKEYFQDCKVNPKYLSSTNSQTVPAGMMATRKMTSAAYQQLLHDPLMADAVEPTSSQAWFIKNGIRMTAISLEKVGANTVVYSSTDRGSVMKVSQPTRVAQPCLLTEMDIYPTGKSEVIKSMAIDTKQHVLYLGSSTILAKLRLEQCSSFLHERSCVAAADPYCGWDDKTKSCISVFSSGYGVTIACYNCSATRKLKQDLITCPKVKDVGWSPWRTCVQSDGNLCRCQVRPCQDRQSSPCEGGLEFRLENCTVDMSVGWEGKEAWVALGVQHGNWSAWEDWGECSAEAWAGVRNRSRTCTNPAPRRGGRPCVGEAVQYEPCSLALQEKEKRLLTNPTRALNPTVHMAVQFNVTCRAKGHKITDISVDVTNNTFDCKKEPQQCEEGEWDNWSEWSQCTVEGFQIRRRNCSVHEPPCAGARLQHRECQPTSENCEGVVGWGPWSSCVCDHGLDLDSSVGVKYSRGVPKFRKDCPNAPSSRDKVKFSTCTCNSEGVKGRQLGPGPSDKSNFGIGHVIGAAVIGCAFTIALCVAAACYVNRRKRRFNVSKADDSHDTSSENKYATIPRTENGELLKEPLSPTSTRDKDKHRNLRLKTPSPLKVLFTKRKEHYAMDSV